MTKKITALLLVVIMTITMSVNVFAAQPAKFEVGKTTTMIVGETVKFTPWNAMATYVFHNSDRAMIDDFGNITAHKVGEYRIEEWVNGKNNRYWIIAVTNADGTTDSNKDYIAKFQKEVFKLVNEERTSRGIDALIWDDSLARAAKVQSDDVSVNYAKLTEKYGTRHRGSDGSTATERAEREGWSGSVGEIIAYNTTPEEVVQAWMNSPKHKKILLNPKYNYAGTGYADISDVTGQCTTTQVFGK